MTDRPRNNSQPSCSAVIVRACIKYIIIVFTSVNIQARREEAHFRPFVPYSRAMKILLLLLSFLLPATIRVDAQTARNCQTVYTEKGQAAYEQCIANERETQARAVVQARKLVIDVEYKDVADRARLDRDSLEQDWRGFDLSLQYRIADLRNRQRYADLANNKDESARLKRDADQLELQRRLTGQHKDVVKRIISDRERLDADRLSMELAEVELSARGFPVVFGTW